MGIALEGIDQLKVVVENEVDNVLKAFIMRLNALGMDCVRYVRDRSKAESWEDQTGNLRSSIGYIIFHDGQPLHQSGFESVQGPKTGSTSVNGHSEGMTYAESLASRFPTGYALVIVAGMNYAAVVEGMENKDVLASGEIYLKDRLDDLLEEFNTQYL